MSEPLPVVEAGGDEQPETVSALPISQDFREEVRQRVKKALAEGRITLEDVAADNYASVYATEVALKKMLAVMEQLSGAPIFQKLMNMGNKRGKKGAAMIDMDAIAAEVEKSFTVIDGGNADGTVQG